MALTIPVGVSFTVRAALLSIAWFLLGIVLQRLLLRQRQKLGLQTPRSQTLRSTSLILRASCSLERLVTACYSRSLKETSVY